MPMGSYGEAVMIPLFCCLVQPVKMGAQTPFLRDFGRHKRLHRRPFCVTLGRPSGCILRDFGAEENRGIITAPPQDPIGIATGGAEQRNNRQNRAPLQLRRSSHFAVKIFAPPLYTFR